MCTFSLSSSALRALNHSSRETVFFGVMAPSSLPQILRRLAGAEIDAHPDRSCPNEPVVTGASSQVTELTHFFYSPGGPPGRGGGVQLPVSIKRECLAPPGR